MVFYKIYAERFISENESAEITRQEKNLLGNEFAEKSELLYTRLNEEAYIFAACIKNKYMHFVVVAQDDEKAEKSIAKYLDMLDTPFAYYETEEITLGTFESLLRSAARNDYVADEDRIIEGFHLDALCNRGRFFGESMIDNSRTLEECKEIAAKHLLGSTLIPELDRIAATSKKARGKGHPVHYILKTDDRDLRRSIYKVLLSALYNAGRITNRRYAFLDYHAESRFPGNELDMLYRMSEGGTVVIRYLDDDEAEGHYAKRSLDLINYIGEVAAKYKNTVQTVFCISNNANKIRDEFLSSWGSTGFIEFYEDVAFGEVAEAYLKAKAKAQKLRTNKKLTSKIEEGKGYTVTDLNKIFDEWLSGKLKNEIYPQYKTAASVKASLKKEQPKGNAYQKLEKLIGLESAKDVMKSALNYFKAQKLFADRGMVSERPSMHMVFTGNPGTAKTTVARLFASIMKENRLLENGDIYEVGRADIVGKYVGSTAPLVKEAFKRAKGGVLFIDEAYSLVDDRDGLYGDEAINTIVQEMENNRDNTVVIFAGYPDKMEKFLNKNPGLRSRIAFHVPFDDYSADELCKIAELIADEKKLVLSSEAIDKLRDVFESAREKSDFGNGRFARNIIEKAKMAQANRLIQGDIDAITDEDIKTLTAEDIELPKNTASEKIVKIGFSA